jgi:hypothetical protein
MSAADQGRTTTADDKSARDPEDIRKDIEETRAELGETVSEVAEKTDVKKQAQAKTDELKEQAGAKVREAKAKAEENPVPVAMAGAFLAGIVLGRLTSR